MIKPGGELVTINDPNSAASEAFRMLRTNIMMRDFDKKIKVINVISANNAEAKTTVCLNLANVFSQANKKVLLIDLDLRLPSVHKKLNIPNEVGITNVLAGMAELKDAVVKVNPYFYVLLSGGTIPFSSEFVQSKGFQDFLIRLKPAFDFIIIDNPPINLVTDGMIVSQYCDGTILCVASGRNDKRDLVRFSEHLEQMKVNVLGVVLTRVSQGKKYGYYYNDKYYGYYYGSKKKESKRKKKDKK